MNKPFILLACFILIGSLFAWNSNTSAPTCVNSYTVLGVNFTKTTSNQAIGCSVATGYLTPIVSLSTNATTASGYTNGAYHLNISSAATATLGKLSGQTEVIFSNGTYEAYLSGACTTTHLSLSGMSCQVNLTNGTANLVILNLVPDNSAYSFSGGLGALITTNTSGVNVSYNPTVPTTIYKYTSNTTFTPNASGTVEVLVVGGGGSGAAMAGGGGGAGGVIYNSSYRVTNGVPISVIVGAGGTAKTVDGQDGVSGSYSLFGTLNASGGGGGGHNTNNGGAGGSGGGGGYATTSKGGAPVTGQGWGGGNSTSSNGAAGNYPASGGGGAGGAGAGATANTGGAGGIGVNYSINGSVVCYGGGGSGSGNTTVAAVCGGGTGGLSLATNGVDGTDGLGGGGGGGGATSSGKGGSGVVIVKWVSVDATVLTSSNYSMKLSYAFDYNRSGGTPYDQYAGADIYIYPNYTSTRMNEVSSLNPNNFWSTNTPPIYISKNNISDTIIRSDMTPAKLTTVGAQNSSQYCKVGIQYGSSASTIVPSITYIPNVDAIADFYNTSDNTAFLKNNTRHFVMDRNSNIWYIVDMPPVSSVSCSALSTITAVWYGASMGTVGVLSPQLTGALTGQCVYTNTTRVIGCSGSDSSGTLTSYTLVANKLGNTTLVCNQTVGGTSATISCTLPNVCGLYGVTFYGKDAVGNTYSLSGAQVQTSSCAAYSYGRDGWMAALVLFGTLAMIGFYSIPVAIMLGIAGLILSMLVGIVPFDANFTIIVSMAVIGLILSFRMKV